jgi:hypothetical protein
MTRVMTVRMLTELTLFLLHVLNSRILMGSLIFLCVLSSSPIVGTFADVWFRLKYTLYKKNYLHQAKILQNLVGTFSCYFFLLRELDTNVTQLNNTH